MTAGGAHVFDGRGGEYRRVATLRDRDGGPTKQFGSALALDDGVALVGTRTGVGPHVFGRTTDGWARVNTLRTAERDAPGAPTAVALDGSRAVVGVSRPDRLDDGGGSVEVFEP